MIDFIIEIINVYGLPTGLAGLFIWFYKQSSDKYNKFLRDAIKEESLRADKTETILKELKETKFAAEETSSKIDELQKTIMSYLLKGQ